MSSTSIPRVWAVISANLVVKNRTFRLRLGLSCLWHLRGASIPVSAG